MDPTLASIRRAAWRSPDRRGMSDWARDNLILPSSFSQSGPLDLRLSPWLMGKTHGPVQAFEDRHIRKVNMCFAVRQGKSLVMYAFAFWACANDPGPLVYNYQTKEIADADKKMRIEPLIEASPTIRELLPQDRTARSRGVYSFPGCNFKIQGGGHNESNLQTIGYRYVLNDEVWQWTPGFIYQAESRAEDYKDLAKIGNVSQASEIETEWDDNFHSGIVHTLVVRCPDCKRQHPLVWCHPLDNDQWAGVVWDKRKYSDGTPDIAHAMATARYRCPLCGYQHPVGQAAVKKLVATGDYSPNYPDAAKVPFALPTYQSEVKGVKNVHSFHCNALASTSLVELVKQWHDANEIKKRGDFGPVKEFIQKKLAVFYSEALTESTYELQAASYKFGDTYEGATDFFMAADAQQGKGDDVPHYWVVVRGVIRGEGASGLCWAGRVDSEEELIELQQRYDVPDKYVVIDGRNDTNRIAEICFRNRWVMLMGDDQQRFPHAAQKGRKIVYFPYSATQFYYLGKGKGRLRKVPYVRWSNKVFKDILNNLKRGRGVKWEVSDGVPQWYIDQLNSEVQRKLPRGGHRWTPKKSSNPNNHIWDAECMCLVRMVVAGVMPFAGDADADTDGGGEEEQIDSAP